MVTMVVLSFVLGYPLFILTAYLLTKILFPDLQKLAEDQKRERALLYQKAQRIKRSKLDRKESVKEESVFKSPVRRKLFSNEVYSNI